MSAKLKASELLKTVRQIGKESPSGSAGCRYFNYDGTPCCIVGHAIYYHGITVDYFEDHDSWEFDDLNEGSNVEELINRLGIENDLDAEQMSTLLEVQSRQDHGTPWGEAVLELGD